MTNKPQYVKEETLLKIDAVGLRFGTKTVLRDVTAQIDDIVRPGMEQGQVVCFLGPSGIGKTRLSRIIAGLDQPTTGRVTLAGGAPVVPGVVGMVAQNYPLFEFATVLENFDIAQRRSGLLAYDSKNRVTRLANQFGLSKYYDMYPAQLSGGTRQRVAIVRQLLCSEHYIVLDEPFSGLDIAMKERACDVIRQVSQLNTLNTIIVVTHDVTEGMSIADTVWLMGIEAGKAPGASIVEVYDLAAEGLAWRPDIQDDQAFMQRVRDVKKRFIEVTP